MVYNTNFVCTYMNETDDNKKNDLYRDNFLDLLELEIFDEEKASNKMEEIFNDIKKSPEFIKLLEASAARYMSEDLELGLMLLFSYDTLYLLHNCLIDFYKNNHISENNLTKIQKFLDIKT